MSFRFARHFDGHASFWGEIANNCFLVMKPRTHEECGSSHEECGSSIAQEHMKNVLHPSHKF